MIVFIIATLDEVLCNHSRCEREGHSCPLQGEGVSNKSTTHREITKLYKWLLRNNIHTHCSSIDATSALWKNNPPEQRGRAPSGPYGGGPYKELGIQHKAALAPSPPSGPLRYQLCHMGLQGSLSQVWILFGGPASERGGQECLVCFNGPVM